MNHVDTTSPITHISLCAGYGGIDLGLKRAIPNLRTILFSEIESFAIANLVSKMESGWLDAAPVWTNLKTLPWDGFLGKVDILSGGFPCQPFSSAGKRDGDEDPRHLFPFILDGIRRCRPAVVFLENVEGILSSKLSGDQWRDPAGTPVLLHVFRELERVGYKCTAGIFSASETGAVHQRKRVFILAYNSNKRLQGSISRVLQSERREESIRHIGSCSSLGSELLAYPDGAGGGEDWQPSKSRSDCFEQSPFLKGGSGSGKVPERDAWPARPGKPQFPWEPPRVVVNSNKPRLQGGGESHTQEWEEHSQDRTGVFGGIAHPSNDGATEVLGNSPEQGSQIGGGLGIVEQEGRVSEDERGQFTPTIEQSSNSCGAEMGNAAKQGLEGWVKSPTLWSPTDTPSPSSRNWKTEPSMGGNPNGIASGMGYAELYISCDNRTDELRLLGNGVVPATAEVAFRTLWRELMP